MQQSRQHRHRNTAETITLSNHNNTITGTPLSRQHCHWNTAVTTTLTGTLPSQQYSHWNT
uniref:Uncharacterized protein n=1 Tax=Anguilla anguilla TaxID=7936 RepID=A0A0E9SZ06_ANGAN